MRRSDKTQAVAQVDVPIQYQQAPSGTRRAVMRQMRARSSDPLIAAALKVMLRDQAVLQRMEAERARIASEAASRADADALAKWISGGCRPSPRQAFKTGPEQTLAILIDLHCSRSGQA